MLSSMKNLVFFNMKVASNNKTITYISEVLPMRLFSFIYLLVKKVDFLSVQ